MLRWQEPRGRYPSGTEQQFPPHHARLCGLRLHPHRHMCLQLAQGHQPVTTALGCSPTESQADGEIRQLSLGRVAKAWVLLVNVVWQRECPDGVPRAMAHPGPEDPGVGLTCQHAPCPRKATAGALLPRDPSCLLSVSRLFPLPPWRLTPGERFPCRVFSKPTRPARTRGGQRPPGCR